VQGASLEQLPPDTVDKLERWDLVQLVELFPRNLKVLLDSHA